MKKSRSERHPTRSKTAVDPLDSGGAVPPQPASPTRDDNAEHGDGTDAALAKHLHDLLNALWPAAASIEWSISEETCPPKFRDTLVEIGRCVNEAMTIASQASALVGSPKSGRAPT